MLDDGTMAEMSVKRSQSAILTPTEGSQFKFPPDAFSSADRLREITNGNNLGHNLRRSFTPIRSALYLKSPDLSPIEFGQNLDYSFKRLPKEKIRKAVADTTVPSQDDTIVTIDEDFTLMPPPPRRRSSMPSTANNNLEAAARQRRLDNNYKVAKKPTRKGIRKPPTPRNSPRNEILNSNVSLRSLLVDTGLDRYVEIFEKEEIDLDIFFMMSDNDLQRIGIDDANDRDIILKFKNMF